MASEFRRRTLLSWSVIGAAGYGLKRASRSPDQAERIALDEGRAWHGQPLTAFAVSPDGAHVATASRPLTDSNSNATEGVVCWRTSDGLPAWRRRLEGGVEQDPAGGALTFSPDGALVGARTRQNAVVSIEVSGSAPVGHQPLSAVEPSHFFFSQDGLRLYLPYHQQAGVIGKVVLGRSALSIAERQIRFDDPDAMPFRLDERGLHLISQQQYLVLPDDGPPVKVGQVLPSNATSFVVSPSRAHVAVLGHRGAFGLVDATTGQISIAMSSAVNTLVLSATGPPLGLDRQYPVWHAYRVNGGSVSSPEFSGKDASEAFIAGTLPVAPSPDGNRAVSIDDDGEVSLWELSSSRRVASLGRYQHVDAVAFPTESRVVVLGPRALVFVDLASKIAFKRYLFPPA